MSRIFGELTTRALKLPEPEREELAQRLWESLDSEIDPSEVPKALRQHRELVEGKVAAISPEEATARLRKVLECKG